MKHARLVSAGAVIGACVATLAGAAIASAAAPHAIRSKPAGYTLVSKSFAATAGIESGGHVRCPKGTVPIGGGVFVRSSPDLRVNVSASGPLGPIWGGAVKNSSTLGSTFTVTAVCAKRPKGYRVVESHEVANPPGTQSKAVATCPSGTRPLGGGGITSSTSTDANMNGTAPKGQTWVVRQNNGSTADATIAAIAVCGKMHGYRVVKGKPFAVTHGLEAGGFASCPAPTVPISGGVFSGSQSVFVNFPGSFKSGHRWHAFVNNSTEGDITSAAVAVCATR
ncbi:MAG: hypothetical protein ACRDQE_00210 [Gaiellales bacterium]